MYLLSLTTLRKIIDEGSYSRAAAALYISQPSVSQHIRQLERIFGTKLIQMSGRQPQLTEAGQIVYDLACKIEGEYEAASLRIDEVLGRSKRLVTIVSNSSLLVYRLPPVIKDFWSEHPEVIVKAFQKSIGEIEDAVKTGFGDIGVLQRTPRPESSLLSIPAWQDEIVAICSPDQPLSVGKGLEAGELTRQRIVLSQARWVREPVEEWFEKHGAKLQDPVEVSSLAQVRADVLEGLGIGFLPKYVVTNDLASGALVQLDIEDFHLSQDSYVIFRSNISQAAQWLVDGIVAAAQRTGTPAVSVPARS